MECSSISLCLHQFLSQAFYSFQHTDFFTSLVRFIPRYLMVFGAIVNGIDSLISLSVAPFLVCRNETDFCALILYPATLLNSWIRSSSFLVESFGFSIYSIMSSVKSESLTSSLQNVCLFLF